MKPFLRCVALLALLACVLSSTSFLLVNARPTRVEQPPPRDENAQPTGTPNSTVRPSATPEATASPVKKELTERERRAQAYAKLLEGQRYLVAARNGILSSASLRSAQQAFLQASVLDPTLAEAHTALAEIAFLLQDVEQAESEARAAIRINPDNFGAHRLLARIYALKSGLFQNNLDKKQAELAIAELREIARLDAKDAEAWALLGELYQATGREREAIEAFTRWASSSSPSPADARYYEVITQGRELSPGAAAARLGEALLRAGRTAEAISALRRAIAIDPTNIRYLELLSRTVEPGSGEKQLDALTELRRVVTAHPANTEAVALLARTEARAGRTEKAIETLRAGIAKSAKDSREQLSLRAELAQIYADALRFEEAVAVFEELLKERGLSDAPPVSKNDKSLAALLLNRIVSLWRQSGQGEKALAAIARMRRILDSTDISADLQLVQLLRQQGKRREALEAVREARARHAQRVEFVRLEAATLAELGQVDEAAAMLRERLKSVPDDYDEYLAIANLYMDAGRGREAVEAARKALDLAPAEQPELVTQALFMLASSQERAGDAKGSEDTLQRILASEPNNATALNNLGYFLVERNERLPEALGMIKRAVSAEPNNPSFLDSLGWAYFKLGQLEEAERYLSDAARRNPSSVVIHEHLGDLYQRRGKSEQALSAWRKALSLSIAAAETSRIKAKLNGASDK